MLVKTIHTQGGARGRCGEWLYALANSWGHVSDLFATNQFHKQWKCPWGSLCSPEQRSTDSQVLPGTQESSLPHFFPLSHSSDTPDNIFLLLMQMQNQSHFLFSINISITSIYKCFEEISLLLFCSILPYTHAYFKQPELTQIPLMNHLFFSSSEPFFVWLHLMAAFLHRQESRGRRNAILHNFPKLVQQISSSSGEQVVSFCKTLFSFCRKVYITFSDSFFFFYSLFRNIYSPKDGLPSINGHPALLMENVTTGEQIVHVIFATITGLNSATC